MHQTQCCPERPLPPPVSLASQSHHEKPPEVTCTSRGNPGFPYSTRERPRETFFSGKRVSTPSFSKFIFIPSCLNKNFMGSIPPCSFGVVGTLQLPQLCWKLESARPCAVVHGILAFFLLSPYIGLRYNIVSLCEYGQLAFTNIYLSTFSFSKKK